MRTDRIRLVLAVTLGVVGMTYASQAAAICVITSCNASCSTNAELGNSIDCTNMPSGGITLTSGADLDLHGHNITCSSNCPARAVVMTNNGSIVKNVLSGENVISGPFGTGLVDCAGTSNSRVTGIRLEQTGAGYAVNYCEKVDTNVIVGSLVVGSTGVIFGSANGDSVRDNYVTGFVTGITGGGHNATIDGNVVVVRDISGSGGVRGIHSVTSSGNITLTNNTLFGDPAVGDLMELLVSGGGTFVLDSDFCDPTSSACAVCESGYGCTAPIAPIVR